MDEPKKEIVRYWTMTGVFPCAGGTFVTQWAPQGNWRCAGNECYPKKELNEIPPTGRGTFGEAGDVARDAVNCTIFGPPEACVGDSILVQVYAHIPDRAQEARSLAHEFDTDARRRGFTSLGTEIRRGTELTFEMTMNSVVIDEPVQQLVWQGYTQGVSFCAGIPKVCTPRVLVGRIMISQESVPNRGTTAA
jgi:hypothetical protein